MTTEEFKKILDKGETDTVEFKSWVKARSQKEIISLAVDELIAFANHKGGTVYFGVEDQPIEVTGCSRDYDSQRIIEGIYDKTCFPPSGAVLVLCRSRRNAEVSAVFSFPPLSRPVHLPRARSAHSPYRPRPVRSVSRLPSSAHG